MRHGPIDDHDAEYWARQLTLGTWLVLGVTTLGLVRIVLDWSAADQWWARPLAVAIVAQAALLLVPWARVVRRPYVRDLLILWWVAELPVLALYAAVDEATLEFYVPGAMLIVVQAGALFAPRIVAALGGLAMLGFLSLVPGLGDVRPTLVVGLAALLAIVCGLCAVTAANRRGQEERRRSVERRTEALLENASDAVLAVDRTGGVLYASPSVRQVFGHEPDWLTSSRLAQMMHPEDLPLSVKWLANLFLAPSGQASRIESRLRRADGTWLHAEVIGTNRTDDADLRAAVLSVRDVGVRRALEEELTRQAFSDSLTGLANRALFRDRVDHALARNRRDGGRVTLLQIDLDSFKVINESLGHSIGDQFLCALATRLRAEVRSCDTLARLGGDEFAVLVEDLDDFDIAALADRILLTARQPIRLGARDVVSTVSIGIATVKAGDDDLESDELLRDADLAMYAAKNGGRDRHALFDPAMYADVLREAHQRADMERALTEDEFVVHYQPIVDLAERRLTGFEALVRWQHPHDGLVGPDSFIPLAEATGLIVPLGRWVLGQACAQLANWHANWPASQELRMSVNLSARQFQYDGLVGDVADALTRTGIDPTGLVLEITESMLMRDTDATVLTLRALKVLGVQLAIDDFGTGYSSLSYLKQFPVDILKIDRSFVDGMTSDSSDASLAEAVVQMGRALHMQTVAEGIETMDQWSALRVLGCEFGQGYLFARPTEPAEIELLLAHSDEALEA